MQFQRLKDPDTGEVAPDRMMMIDDQGQVSTFMKGHRFWDLYVQWLEEGNEPLDAT